MKKLSELQLSIQLLLDADRDTHQVVIAEKMALVATEDEEYGQASQISRDTSTRPSTA
jgi:hypothetical protein